MVQSRRAGPRQIGDAAHVDSSECPRLLRGQTVAPRRRRRAKAVRRALAPRAPGLAARRQAGAPGQARPGRQVHGAATPRAAHGRAGHARPAETIGGGRSQPATASAGAGALDEARSGPVNAGPGRRRRGRADGAPPPPDRAVPTAETTGLPGRAAGRRRSRGPPVRGADLEPDPDLVPEVREPAEPTISSIKTGATARVVLHARTATTKATAATGQATAATGPAAPTGPSAATNPNRSDPSRLARARGATWRAEARTRSPGPDTRRLVGRSRPQRVRRALGG
jgi:hypothetical protein